MAQSTHLVPLYIVTAMLLFPIISSSSSNGFSLEFIYADHPSNLTTTQRLQRFFQSSESRLRRLKSRIFPEFNTTIIRPPLLQDNYMFLVVARVGTGHGLKTYNFIMDTGSSLTWTQCVGCNPCFPQNQPLFDPRKSRTLRNLPSTSTLCVPPYGRPDGHGCAFRMTYGDQSWAAGTINQDTFTFAATNARRKEAINELVFGCTYQSHMNLHGEPSGMLGMANSPISFARQLAHRTNGRFSYCLFRPGDATTGFLRFGNDIRMNSPVRRTRFLHSPNSPHFMLELHDISLNGQHFRFPPGTFERFIIDSGSGVTYLIRPAYTYVKGQLRRFFEEHYRLSPYSRGEPFDLCYVLPRNFVTNLPTFTLHFAGADFVVQPREMFFVNQARNYFCFAVNPHNEFSILGAHQQFNTRFTYDVANQELLFSPENCARDAHN